MLRRDEQHENRLVARVWFFWRGAHPVPLAYSGAVPYSIVRVFTLYSPEREVWQNLPASREGQQSGDNSCP